MGFLTIEDVNTNNLSIINEFYSLDTILLGDADYSNKVYDFVKVNRSTASDTITFEFKIVNSLWTGGFYVTDSNGTYIDISNDYTYDSTNNILSVTADDDIILHLYLCSFWKNTYTSFQVEQLSWIHNNMNEILESNLELDLINLNDDTIGGCYINHYYSWGSRYGVGWSKKEYGYKSDAYTQNISQLYKPGIIELFDDNNNNHIYLKVNIVKYAPRLRLEHNQEIFLGEINRVEITEDYVPGRTNFNYTGFVEFNNTRIPIVHELVSIVNEWVFYLDLREYTGNKIDFTVCLEDNDIYVPCRFDFSLNVDYRNITNESSLITAINKENEIINLGADIVLTNDILINSPLKIIGNNHSIDLNGHSIILNNDINFKAENLLLDKGDTAIIQGKNTKVELDNVTFTNCVSTDYNNLGSCILCDIDINSLDSADDYITNLKDCTFINNHNCIVHGGELTISNCKYLNNDITYTDKNNVAFLYQIDGNANVNNSIFDINYNSDNYCVNEENRGNCTDKQ